MSSSAAAALRALRLPRRPSGLAPRLPLFVLLLLPALCLLAFRLWGESGLLAVALTAPVLAALAILLLPVPAARPRHAAPPARADIEAALQDGVDARHDGHRVCAALAIGLDNFRELGDRLGHRGTDAVLQRVGERIAAALRADDLSAYLDGGVYAVALAPVPCLDLETLLQIAGRLQHAIAEPISVGGLTFRVTVSIGFCHSERLPAADGGGLLDAAEAAMSEARRHGPGTIRAYSVDLHRRRARLHKLRDRAAAALEAGEIRAWFQPQVSTDTGALSGFEALARWHQPDGMVIAPADFLPALAQAGLIDRLGNAILTQSLAALRDWDRAGVAVPAIGMNLSECELRDATLLDRIAWDLDRFGLAPARLTIEVLESVIAGTPEDTVCRNIHGLAEMGCRIDLDDFGTGSASITSIRRFSVTRLKIDRSFVRGIDLDRDQQRMMAAILTMAEQMGLETLAEGVETPAEHALLGQLGCRHVQGFAVSPAMPAEDTLDWIARHDKTLRRAPQVGRPLG